MTQSSIEAEIGLCILFSAVDGEISDKELGALAARIGQLLGDDFDFLRLPALLEGELDSISEQGVDAYIAKLPGRVPGERRYEAIRAACAVAYADGLAAEEEQVIRQVCGVLDVDAEEVIGTIGARNDTLAAAGDAHDDEPNEATTLIAEQLLEHGWIDPMQSLRDAGITVSGVGALALNYETPNGHLLRIEHHTCDGSLHLHVSDEQEAGSHMLLFPTGRETELVAALVAMQDQIMLENLDEQLAKFLSIARVCIFHGETLIELEKPS